MPAILWRQTAVRVVRFHPSLFASWRCWCVYMSAAAAEGARGMPRTQASSACGTSLPCCWYRCRWVAPATQGSWPACRNLLHSIVMHCCMWHTFCILVQSSRRAAEHHVTQPLLMLCFKHAAYSEGAWMVTLTHMPCPPPPCLILPAAARAVQDPCTSQSNCYRCQSTPGCTWCYSGWPAPLDKPSCISSLSECSGFVKSIQECPVDRIPAATAAAGSSTAVTCASLSSCRECLRFTYQCRWCVTGESGRWRWRLREIAQLGCAAWLYSV